MTGKRDYDDGCGVAHALELVGERWALLVIRELMLGPKRFTDLRNDLPGISPNVLSQRLSELEASSIVVKRRLPPPAAVTAYELSAWGRELEPFIRDFGRWASRSPRMPQGRPMSVNSIVLSSLEQVEGQGAIAAWPAGHMGVEAVLRHQRQELERRAEKLVEPCIELVGRQFRPGLLHQAEEVDDLLRDRHRHGEPDDHPGERPPEHPELRPV